MSSPEEVMEVIDEGKANRHVAVTSKCCPLVANKTTSCRPCFPQANTKSLRVVLDQ